MGIHCTYLSRYLPGRYLPSYLPTYLSRTIPIIEGYLSSDEKMSPWFTTSTLWSVVSHDVSDRDVFSILIILKNEKREDIASFHLPRENQKIGKLLVADFVIVTMVPLCLVIKKTLLSIKKKSILIDYWFLKKSYVFFVVCRESRAHLCDWMFAVSCPFGFCVCARYKQEIQISCSYLTQTQNPNGQETAKIQNTVDK